MTEFKIILKSIKFKDISIVIKYDIDTPKNRDVTKEDIDILLSAYYNNLDDAKKKIGLKDGDGWYVANVEKVS